MIEDVENRGLEEALELEGTRDEFSKCKKSKIMYTRALLLELTEVEVCRKLPSDFDLLILRQLDGGSDTMVELEHKSIIVKPFEHGLLPTTTWNLASPGERWGNHLYTRSKESHLQINCSLDRKDVCRLLPQKLEKDAGVVHCEIQKSCLFQLSKTENPYRPPHLNKKIPPPQATFYEPGVESSGEFDHKDSTDDTTEHDKSVYGFALADANHLTKDTEGNEVNESSEPLDESEEFWRKNEENEVIAFNKSLKGLIEDNQPTFDDFWEEILETIHLQQVPNTSPMNSHSDSEVEIQFPDEPSAEILEMTHLQQELNTSPMDSHSDSEVEIHFPDEESLTSVDPLLPPENLNSLNLDEFNLPDEDSLISIDDMIGHDLRNNSKFAHAAKLDGRSKRLHRKAQTSPNFSGLATHGQLHYHLPHNLLCDQTSFLPLLLNPNILPYLPFCPETSLSNTKTNSPVSHYSLLHQPNIFPQLPNHLVLGTTCSDPKNRMAVYDADTMQFLHSTSQQAIHEGFGKSEAGIKPIQIVFKVLP